MDLLFIVLLTLISIPVVEFTTGVIRVILGMIILLIFPGYSLMSALFPNNESLSGMERLMLTFVLSFTVIALAGLGLNYTPWGIRLTPIVITAPVLILLFCGIALFRRSRLIKDKRFKLHFNVHLPAWSGISWFDRILYSCLIIIVIGSIATLGYTIARPKPQEYFTNFYMLGTESKMENYPRQVKLGNSVSVTLGIENHEIQATTYNIKVNLNGQEVQSFGPYELTIGEKWSQDIVLLPTQIGDNQQFVFLLYKDNDPDKYLTLRLWVDVTQ
jgi:uncharacterized membrane protein